MSNIQTGRLILQVAIPSPLRRTFDYLLPANSESGAISPGVRVLVPFGKQEIIGLILQITNISNIDINKLKPIIAILDQDPILPKSILDLIQWTSKYYHHPIGDVVSNTLPVLLRDKERKKKLLDEVLVCKNHKNKLKSVPCADKIDLNQYQSKAIDTISNNLDIFKPFLLNGVTGSGKTEVYLRTIKEVIAKNKQALVLIPEINLTPQTIQRFTDYFDLPIAVLHSRLTPKERLHSWLRAANGAAKIIIGTRSAIFTPLQNPGIIIIDEEHDASFKQQAGLRYSARDLAIVRAKLENIPVILGSATPSIESIYNVKCDRYIELNLPNRAGAATQPKFHLIDMRNQNLKNGITANLLAAIKKHLDNNDQVLIFINRRGFAPILICHQCGWNAICKHCDAKLTLHQNKSQLLCHHCGANQKIPDLCPACSHNKLMPLGLGTQRIESALQELFPEHPLIRIDRDSTVKKYALEQILEKIKTQEYKILVGTQMLAKGHHFPNVTMVVVLDVDQGLFSSDFRAGEHLAQLIMQVSGRAGRAQKVGEVYLQTHNPHNPLLLNLINNGYQGFVDACLIEREHTNFPPYSYLALLNTESKDKQAALTFLQKIQAHIKQDPNSLVTIFGPIPALMERKAGNFRAQLLIQSQNRKNLQQYLDKILCIIEQLKPGRNIHWHLDVDPIDLSN